MHQAPTQHLQRLAVVLSRLQQEGLKVKFEKYAFFQKEVRYLLHIISSRGVSTDPAKIEAVAKWQRPRHVSELCSFIGFSTGTESPLCRGRGLHHCPCRGVA